MGAGAAVPGRPRAAQSRAQVFLRSLAAAPSTQRAIRFGHTPQGAQHGKTTSAQLISRSSARKPDDGHRAADTKSKDLKPLIRIIDAAIQETRPGQPVKVLFLKQDVQGKFFLTTEFGLACTSDLRDRVLALHTAIHAPGDALRERGRKDSSGGQTGVFGALRRTLTNRPSRRRSGSRSPEKRPSQLAPSPRSVQFSPTNETHFVKVSPRKPPVATDPAHTPRLGQERHPESSPLPEPSSRPPQRPLPAVPTAGLNVRLGEPATPSPKSPPLVMTDFERHRARPQPSLPTTPTASQRTSQKNTPGTTPRDPD